MKIFDDDKKNEMFLKYFNIDEDGDYVAKCDLTVNDKQGNVMRYINKGDCCYIDEIKGFSIE